MATDVPAGEIRPNSQKAFESSITASKPDGWITRDGAFFACAPDEHDECAEFILNQQRKDIEFLLTGEGRYGMVGPNTEHSPRTILKSAGFALLSDNQLAESNLPEALSLKQMEFAEKNNLVFMPMSGQLDLATYKSFLEKVKELEGVQKLLRRKNVVIKNFLDDPTKMIHIEDNESFTKQIFDVLSEGSTAEISLESSKSIVTWRRLDIPDHEDVFLEHEYHNHGYDSFPETESFVMLTNKQAIKGYLEKKRRAGYHPKGNLSVLN